MSLNHVETQEFVLGGRPDVLSPMTFQGGAEPHWHCPHCWSTEFIFMNGGKVCPNIECLNRPMVLCIPAICGSS